MTNQRKYGSFKTVFKTVEGEEEEVVVSPLTQNQIGDGWRLQLPQRRRFMVTYTDDNGNTIQKMRNNQSYFKVNLAELPPHLYNKMKPVYKQGEFSHHRAIDNCYTYLVQSSPVDKEIRVLADFIQNYDRLNYYSEKEMTRYRNMLKKVKENDINGWVVFKSQHLLTH